MLLRVLLLAIAASTVQFRNVADHAGLNAVLDNGPTPEKHLIETMAGGVAAFDYDNDGRTDLLFTNGAGDPALYRNLGGGRFENVTPGSGLTRAGYAIGVAAGDFDNDGNVDLFVAGVNRSTLYRNRGGHFEDAGLRVEGWAIAAGWFDFDKDGLLDLFVVRYVQWDPATERACFDSSGKLRIFCHPRYYQGLSNLLFRNRGNGTFEDVSERSGIARHIGKGMSLAFADYDNDGFPDVFVTNDTQPNFLFHNRGNGTFEEVGLDAGAALLDHGKPVSSMGVDFRDYDNDGRADLSLTALQGETFPVFRNLGKGQFQDQTYASHATPATIRYSGWANALLDFDNDGWKDLFFATGHVTDNIEQFSGDKYKQANVLLLNNRDGTFAPFTKAFPGERAHRGAAFADFNGDGKLDIAVACLGDKPELWENTTANANHWLELKLTGTKSNRDGIGAKVTIGNQMQEYFTSFGYASSSHAGLHFGLGPVSLVPRIDIRWPSGVVQTLRDVPADRVLQVREP